MLLRNERGLGIGYYVTTIVLDIVLGVLAAIIVAWFSRQREFRADRGGVMALFATHPPIEERIAALQGGR